MLLVPRPRVRILAFPRFFQRDFSLLDVAELIKGKDSAIKSLISLSNPSSPGESRTAKKVKYSLGGGGRHSTAVAFGLPTQPAQG